MHTDRTDFVRGGALTGGLEHEIRRRPTDRREVIMRMTRILFARGFYSVFYTHTDRTDIVRGGALTGGLNTRFLNTNNQNNTNVFWHTDLTHGSFSLRLIVTVESLDF